MTERTYIALGDREARLYARREQHHRSQRMRRDWFAESFRRQARDLRRQFPEVASHLTHAAQRAN